MKSSAGIRKEIRKDELTIQLEGIITAESALQLVGALHDRQPGGHQYCIDSENLQEVAPLGRFVLHGFLHQFGDMAARLRFKDKFSHKLRPPALRAGVPARLSHCHSGCHCVGRCVTCKCAAKALGSEAAESAFEKIAA